MGCMGETTTTTSYQREYISEGIYSLCSYADQPANKRRVHVCEFCSTKSSLTQEYELVLELVNCEANRSQEQSAFCTIMLRSFNYHMQSLPGDLQLQFCIPLLKLFDSCISLLANLSNHGHFLKLYGICNACHSFSGVKMRL